MNKKQFYILKFAFIICIFASAIISLTAVGLQSKKELNIETDRKKKILAAVGLSQEVSSAKNPHAILNLYDDKIKSIVVNESGDVVSNVNDDSITISSKGPHYPVYLRVETGKVEAIAIPVIGKGLWSTLYGYFALEKDLTTVKAITFYKHGETPGLGGEIEKPWFQDNFVGKTIFDHNNQLTPTQVVKGKVAEIVTDAKVAKYSVDGISGATITSKGVTEMMSDWLKAYEPFLRKARKSGIKVK